jgi:hypothetical protein
MLPIKKSVLVTLKLWPGATVHAATVVSYTFDHGPGALECGGNNVGDVS